MIFENAASLDQYLKSQPPKPPVYPKKVVMVLPDFFDVTYAINPYMTDSKGDLNQIDRALAVKQWNDLKETYEKLGLTVETLKAHPELPDMVFAANQSFSFIDPKNKKKSILLSQMRSPYRRPEVALFKAFYEESGFAIHELQDPKVCFEGNGDALIQPGKGLVWGAYGPRTDKKIYEEISNRFSLPVVRFELLSKDFYHLDTCFSILNDETIAIQKAAFSTEAIKMMQVAFRHRIEIDYEENLRYFSANCHCPNGKDVILQKGSQNFKHNLLKAGFRIHEVDTSEFIKAGGSVFCLKKMLF